MFFRFHFQCRVARPGLDNVVVRLIDAERTGLPSEAYDHVIRTERFWTRKMKDFSD
jgi:hypothetical protein